MLKGIPKLEFILNYSFKQPTLVIHTTRNVVPSDIIHLKVLDMISLYHIERGLDAWWYSIAEKHGLYTVPARDNGGAMFRMIIDNRKMEDYKISVKTIRDKIIESES